MKKEEMNIHELDPTATYWSILQQLCKVWNYEIFFCIKIHTLKKIEVVSVQVYKSAEKKHSKYQGAVLCKIKLKREIGSFSIDNMITLWMD